MSFLMLPITSSNSIDKWVILGKSWFFAILSDFFLLFLIGLSLGSYLSNLDDFYDSEYYSSISSFKWHQFQGFVPLQTVTINDFK